MATTEEQQAEQLNLITQEPEEKKRGRGRPAKPKFPPYTPTNDASSPDVASKPGKEAIRIQLNDAGNIDIEHMQAKTVQRVKELLSNPSTREALGMTTQEATALVLTDEDVAGFYNILGGVECWLATRIRKIPDDIARRHIPFEEREIKMLMEPTKVVAAKWIPATALVHKDEIALLLMLAMIHRDKWSRATEESNKRAELENKIHGKEKEPQQDAWSDPAAPVGIV